jgi:hypothetical protein
LLLKFTLSSQSYTTLSNEDHHVSTVIRRRDDLRLLEGTEVKVSARVKELRKHERRKDLHSYCLVNVFVTPQPLGETIYLSHIFILKRQFKKIGRVPDLNERITFMATIYSYRRLGGKSLDRGLYNSTDYGLLPVSYVN